ncbi:hypothetical protein TNCV_4545141, partial [Trichonephila clavipes]
SIAQSRHSSRFLGVFSSCRTNGKILDKNGVPTFDFVYELKNIPYLCWNLREAGLVFKKILASGKCSSVMKLRSKACQEKEIDVFTTFLELVRERDWTDFTDGTD